MNLRRYAMPAGAAGLILLAACANAAGGESGRRFYVDYAAGDDSRDGTSSAQAWKHAPGDRAAAGQPGEARLGPGDRVIFAAGVSYRGAIKLERAGSAGSPIVFEGAAGAPAAIDGSDPAGFAPCANAAECGGLARWKDLVLVSLDQPMAVGAELFSDKGMLRPARTPDPKDDFYRDEIEDMLSAQPAELARGELRLPAGSGTLLDGARVALWIRPNIVIEKPITSVTAGKVRFDPAGVDFYPDRPGKYAVVGMAGALDRPGEYVVLPGGRQIVAMLPNGAKELSVAQGRGGFELKGASHVAIRNLTFRNMADGGDPVGGLAIFSSRNSARGIDISGNRFTDMYLPNGQGPITLRGAGSVVINGNLLRSIVAGSGIRLSGPGSNLIIRGNRIHRVGRTAIMLMKLDDALVEGNVITDVKGVHGNGLSAYLDNRRVRFVRNTVLDAKQPATFRGGAPGMPMTDNAIEFRENLLVATPGALGSLIAWGGTARGVTITRNILLGGRFGLRIPSGNQLVVTNDNVGLRPVTFPGQPTDWKQANNVWFDKYPPWVDPLIKAATDGVAAGRAQYGFDCGQIFGGREKPARIGATIACRDAD